MLTRYRVTLSVQDGVVFVRIIDNGSETNVMSEPYVGTYDLEQKARRLQLTAFSMLNRSQPSWRDASAYWVMPFKRRAA